MPEDHDWYGIPYPGTYLVDENGEIFEKSFIADHGARETVNNFLQESFSVSDMERGETRTVKTEHLTATACFSSPILRRAQRMVLSVEINLADQMHVSTHIRYLRAISQSHSTLKVNIFTTATSYTPKPSPIILKC